MITDGSEVVIDEEKWYEYAIDIPAYVHRAIGLYRRCQMFNEIALPAAGGVLDQPEETVQLLERIHQVYSEYQRKKQQDAQFRIYAQRRRMKVEESGGGRIRRRR